MTSRTRPYPAGYHLPVSRVTRVTDQSIPNATNTAVTWTAVSYDTSVPLLWNSSTRLTAQIAGVYHFEGCGTWAINATGARYLWLMHNGATVAAIASGGYIGATWYHGQTVGCDAWMDKGDYMEFMGYQNSGAALNLAPGTTGYPMSMSANCVYPQTHEWSGT